MTAIRISELAGASGFPAATLRYYETVGLLRPERDENGYRRYRSADVDRMRFVARAKQLGLRLEEIAELVELRGDGDCPPVRGRLSTFVDVKLAETRGSIGELRAFEADLAQLARQLRVGDAPETCGDACGCPDHPLQVDESPLACTLDDVDLGTRLDEWRAVTAAASASEPTGTGWRLRLPTEPDLAGRVAALAAAEQRCCAFLTFRLDVQADGLVLDVTAPPEATSMIAALFATTAC